MTNARDIIIRPLITEKAMKMMQDDNKVTFVVAKGVNKTQVRQAIESIFNVKVEAINMLNVRGKKKRVGKYTGMTSAYKKAIVKLPEGQDIDLGIK